MRSWFKAEIKDNTGLFIRIRSSLQLTDLVATPLNYGNEQMYSVGHPGRYLFGPKLKGLLVKECNLFSLSLYLKSERGQRMRLSQTRTMETQSATQF